MGSRGNYEQWELWAEVGIMSSENYGQYYQV